MSDYFLPLSRKKIKRDSDTLHYLLREWSGKEIAAQKVISKLPPTEHISNGIEEAIKKLLPPSIAILQKIKSDWNQIAGKQIAQFMTPANIYDGTLFIEVSHPAWLMEFKAEQQQILLSKIQAYIGSKQCNKIKLIPVGKNVQRKN